MEIKRVYSVYFSATYSTKRIVNGIAGAFGRERHEIDVTNKIPEHEVVLDSNDVLIAGVPVYGGRVPVGSIAGFNGLKGNGTPAVIVNVYGNRDYDDALVELSDILSANGFVPVAAAAVVAEHCIFPEVGSGRPDAEDWDKIMEFCTSVQRVLDEFRTCDAKVLPIKGKRPYKKYGGVPIHPSAGKECDGCGTCARHCPFGAIPLDNPKNTDSGKCAACCRCIHVCPREARKFRGLLPKIAGWKFTRDNAVRKEPEFVV